MVIFDNVNVTGKVGIGISNPTEKLEVDGKVKATELMGKGPEITDLNGENITTGTIDDARIPSTVARETRFDPTTGHNHTGTQGDGPRISHGNLSDILQVDPSSDDNDLTRHVSDALAKGWQDHINITSGNPHGTTAVSVGALPDVGGTIEGSLQVNGDIMANANLVINGNVGIETANPKEKLDVFGTIRLHGKNAFQGHDTFLRINQDNEFPNGTHFAHRANFHSGITTGTWSDVDPGVGNLLVQGKVGIGVQDPSQNLEVVGDIKMHPVKSIPTIPLDEITEKNKTTEEIQNFPNISSIIIGNGEQAKALHFIIRESVFGPTDPIRTISVGDGWSFNSASKNFLINHPLHPDTHELVHSTLEGPEVAVFYRGEAQLLDGKAIVTLPDYFEALAREENRTVLLTPKFERDDEISMLAASEVKDGKFTVKMIDSKNPSQKFYWEVKAIRADVNILEVERVKAPSNSSD